MIRRLATVLVLFLGVTTLGQESAPPERPDHPLVRLADEQLRRQQILAGRRVVEVAGTLRHAGVDVNGNGVAEPPTTVELLGLGPWRGTDGQTANVLTWPGVRAVDEQTVLADGYLFRIVQPTASKAPAGDVADIAADLAERDAVVVTWPARYGRTGRVALAQHVRAESMLASDGRSPDELAARLLVAGRDGLAEAERPDGWSPLAELQPLFVSARVDLTLAAERPWADAAWCERELLRAVRRVRAARGLPEDAPPATLSVVGPREIHAALVAELQPILARVGGWAEAQAGLPMTAAATPAKYVPDDRTLLLAPTTLEVVAALEGVAPEDVEKLLRAVILHEAVHVVDFDTTPLAERRDACDSATAFVCWNAVVEGHAQHVARSLAAADGLADAIDTMSGLASGPDESQDSATRAGSASLAFLYHEGEAFVAAIERLGGRNAVEEVLRDPPRRTMWIVEPELWMRRDELALPDVEAALSPVAALDPNGAQVTSSPVIRGALEEMLAGVPEIDAGDVARGVLDGQTRSAVAPDGSWRLQAVALVCRNAAAAEGYRAASATYQRRAREAMRGAGDVTSVTAAVEGGVRMVTTVRQADRVVFTALAHTAVRGRCVVEVTAQVQGPLDEASTANIDAVARQVLDELTGASETETE